MVSFSRHFHELFLPLDLSETFTLSNYLFSMVLSLSRMINSREIKSYLRLEMISKLIFDNITPPLKTQLSSTMNTRGLSKPHLYSGSTFEYKVLFLDQMANASRCLVDVVTLSRIILSLNIMYTIKHKTLLDNLMLNYS